MPQQTPGCFLTVAAGCAYDPQQANKRTRGTTDQLMVSPSGCAVVGFKGKFVPADKLFHGSAVITGDGGTAGSTWRPNFEFQPTDPAILMATCLPNVPVRDFYFRS